MQTNNRCEQQLLIKKKISNYFISNVVKIYIIVVKRNLNKKMKPLKLVNHLKSVC